MFGGHKYRLFEIFFCPLFQNFNRQPLLFEKCAKRNVWKSKSLHIMIFLYVYKTISFSMILLLFSHVPSSKISSTNVRFKYVVNTDLV